MRPRQSLLDIFSTFIELEADCFSGWFVDGRLRRSFEQHQAQVAGIQPSESAWALYWYQRWQQEPNGIAFGHLSAYLQEVCYWSAHRTIRRVGYSSYGLSDCFQLASMDVKKVLQGYEPDRGASLKGYAGLVYASLLRDTLRQRQEADICTVWTLLRRVGKQRLVEALRQAGLSSTAMAQYRLAWMCYKAMYGAAKVPGRKLRQPTCEQFAAIAKLYNTERSKLSEPGPLLSPERLQQCLIQCADWVREYAYPTLLSLNVPHPNREFQELQDDLAASPNPSLLMTIIEREEAQQRQDQQAQLNNVLAAAIAQLTPDNQTLLHLYYHDQLTQQQTAQQLNLKQYTVSRRLTRTRENLLSVVTEWAQTALHIPFTPDLVMDMSVALEEWLTVHHRNRA